MWPPVGILVFNPFQVPLLNTVILLRSGITVTWAHMSLVQNNLDEFNYRMRVTLLLAIFFLLVQFLEYKECKFRIADSSFGSIFFLITGFHGFHVLVGFLFLLFCLFRLYHFRNNRHLGFEFAS